MNAPLKARIVVLTASCWLAAGLSGCMVGPDYVPPELTPPTDWVGDFPTGEVVDAQSWWTGFRDPDLDALVARGLAGNLDIIEASAAVAQAWARVDAARSGLYPVVDGSVGGGVSADSDGSSDTTGDAGLLMRFVPDLFGAQRRRFQAATAAAEAARLRLADVQRRVSAGIALQYVELRRTQARLALLDESLELQQQTLQIVRLRREAGLAADLDVQRATADLARNRAQRGVLLSARTRASNRLAVLLGEPPAATLVPDQQDPVVPEFTGSPARSAPAALLRRRPDLRASEQDLIAATANVGIEVADLYPSLQLPGRISVDLSDGFAAAEVIAALDATLGLPLIDAGGRRAEVRAAEAAARSALARYRATLLASIQEVEDALVAVVMLGERSQALAGAVSASEQAFEQLDALYREGLATFIDILDAQRQLIGSRESLVDATASVAGAVVELHTALGGGTLPDPGS